MGEKPPGKSHKATHSTTDLKPTALLSGPAAGGEDRGGALMNICGEQIPSTSKRLATPGITISILQSGTYPFRVMIPSP